MANLISHNSRRVSLLVACGILLSTMDSSMVNVALPEIMRAFGVGVAEVKLVVLVYLMVITFSLVFWGRIGDEFGKGRVYLAGMVLFACGASVCAFSSVFSWLVVCRAVQALGASMMMATGPAILKLTSPREHLGKTLGFVGIATSCGLMAGPLVSGYLLTFFSWPGVFMAGVPLALAGALFGMVYLLPEINRREELRNQPFDWSGTMLWVAIVIGYVLLVNGAIVHWAANILAAFMVLLLIGCFLRVEGRAEAPILPLALIRRRYYWTGVVTSAISFAALFMVIILMPFYLDYLLHFPVGRIGLAMMALPLSLVVVAPFSGWLYDRLASARKLSTAGLLLSAVAVFALIGLDTSSSLVDVWWRLALVGMGQAIFLSPNSASVLSRVQDRYSGITSGILATSRNFGMLTGTALAGSGFSFFFASLTGEEKILAESLHYADAFLGAQRLSFGLAFILLLLGAAISWSRGR